VKVTVHHRKETYISTEQEVIDVVEEVVILDPEALDYEAEQTDERVQETTGYLTSRRRKRARVFYSNI